MKFMVDKPSCGIITAGEIIVLKSKQIPQKMKR